MKAIFKLLKGVFYILLTCIVAACCFYCYARFVEPRLPELKTVSIASERITEPLRIVAFADTHIGNGMDGTRLEGFMDKIAGQKPDIVVFLGDLFDNYSVYTAGDEESLARILSLEQLPDVKKFAVYGNHDLGGKAKKTFRSIMDMAGYRVLVNEAETVSGIALLGCDDLIFGNPDISGISHDGLFTLLLVHEPDYADRVANIDLQLSGHTHGGQVRLPFVGPLVLPQYGRNYVSGLYEKPDGGQLYVTRGLGMSKLPFRFAARPEITVVDLLPS